MTAAAASLPMPMRSAGITPSDMPTTTKPGERSLAASSPRPEITSKPTLRA